MTKRIHSVDAQDDLMSALRTMFSHRCSCVIVTSEGRVCGIITERDVVRIAAARSKSLEQARVADGMTARVFTITPHTTVVEAAKLMRRHRCRRFPVVTQDGKLVGVVTQTDIVTAAKRELEQYSHRLEQEVQERTHSLQAANQELVRLSVTDPLTGLYNRRFLFQHMDDQIDRLCRTGGHLSCIMMDLDRFKHINDTFGHERGDHVLVNVAQTMQNQIRRYDIAARYGGEEFAIVTDCDESTAASVADRIRAAVAEEVFTHDRSEFHVTMSAGVASRDFPAVHCDADSLVGLADVALYAAKNAGRDRTVQSSAVDAPVRVPAQAATSPKNR